MGKHKVELTDAQLRLVCSCIVQRMMDIEELVQLVRDVETPEFPNIHRLEFEYLDRVRIILMDAAAMRAI